MLFYALDNQATHLSLKIFFPLIYTHIYTHIYTRTHTHTQWAINSDEDGIMSALINVIFDD